MKLKVLLLFISCFFSIFTNLFCQEIVKQESETRIQDRYFEKENIINVSSKKYYWVSPHLKFDLSLLEYTQEYSETEQYEYDKNGNITMLNRSSKIKQEDRDGVITTSNSRFEMEYDGNLLSQIRTSFSDTLAGTKTFQYFYNSDERINKIELKITEPDTSYIHRVEEIEYLEGGGRKSTLYNVRDSSKVYQSEFVFDSNENLLFINYGLEVHPYSIEYFYTSDNKISHTVIRIGKDKSKISGTYIKSFYNKKGVLKKTKVYNLVGEERNGSNEYWSGKLKTTNRHKEKTKGRYTLRLTKEKDVDGPSKLTYRTILDQNRNLVLQYFPRGRTLQTWNISYRK